MENDIFIISQGFIVFAAGFLVEGIKKAGMPKKYLMLIAAIIGAFFGAGFAYIDPSISLYIGVVGGIIAGASASGFYSGGKSLKKKDGK